MQASSSQLFNEHQSSYIIGHHVHSMVILEGGKHHQFVIYSGIVYGLYNRFTSNDRYFANHLQRIFQASFTVIN